jgi:hypothetical protein
MEQVMTRCMVKTICIYRLSAAKHPSIFPDPSPSLSFITFFYKKKVERGAGGASLIPEGGYASFNAFP